MLYDPESTWAALFTVLLSHSLLSPFFSTFALFKILRATYVNPARTICTLMSAETGK